MSPINISIDSVVNAAYIRLRDGEVCESVSLDDLTVVDVDEFGVALGIELLDQAAEIPFNELLSRFHVHTDVVDLLRALGPSPIRTARFTQAVDGSSTATPSPYMPV
ncbi:DUF2283 domain-containing protein [Nocardioides sp. TRM66260-LWL]|uniref:DUF2283 domain-containing protein n=1 Tax=Nocardioides sp. TRM66260-LWL TaxID=2874478 RepID=UPI001CC7A586|nr:DUF2283 domain-containing protein [Nocardioides sp. TRM66260-LWL]MBZ5735635.1 DUF2283 domain-containing protein [Nocardioides sp. TRM66260-LWL]